MQFFGYASSLGRTSDRFRHLRAKTGRTLPLKKSLLIQFKADVPSCPMQNSDLFWLRRPHSEFKRKPCRQAAWLDGSKRQSHPGPLAGEDVLDFRPGPSVCARWLSRAAFIRPPIQSRDASNIRLEPKVRDAARCTNQPKARMAVWQITPPSVSIACKTAFKKFAVLFQKRIGDHGERGVKHLQRPQQVYAHCAGFDGFGQSLT